MRILLTKWFRQFAGNEGIANDSLKALASGIEGGEQGASLGGGLYKYRLAKPGKGKSGGYRVIVGMKQGERLFFLYGFSKSVRENITSTEQRDLKEFAKALLDLDDKAIDKMIAAGGFMEI
jgi:hypothetical protein